MKKILIVKIGAIGDVVMSLPMATALRAESEVHITWIVGKIPSEIVMKSRVADSLVAVDEKKLFHGTLFEKTLEILKVWKEVAGKKFDQIINAHVDWRYGVLSALSFGKQRMHWKRVPDRSQTSEYVKLALGKEAPIVFPEWTGEKIFKNAVALAPGGAKNVLADNSLRRWPIENYVRVSEWLIEAGYTVILTGSDSDEWIRGHFSHLHCEDLIGRTSLTELVSIFKHCSLIITHDSGPLHLAKLARCPTLALFGPTNPKEFAGEKIHVIWGGEGLSCRPCYDGKNFPDCPKALCMHSISVEGVINRCKQLLKLP